MNKSTANKKNFVDHSTLDVKGNLHIGDVTYIVNEKTVVIPHQLTNNIPSNAERILGRDKELMTIVTHLAQNRPTVLVNGIGGIGKTSVAAKYVAIYRHTYKHLAWLTVQSSLAEAFINDIVLLKALHIEQDIRQLIETQRFTDAFKLVIHRLNTLENTLVILDNANNVEDLMDNKSLFDTAKCHYLITSRTQPQDWTIVPIDVLSEDEAVALFRKIAPSVSAPKGENVSNDDLKSLLSKLFYHTLLIELVAKAVENAGFSFAELQTMIETKFIHDENLNEDIVSKGNHGDNYSIEAKRTKIEEYIWLIFSNVKDLGENTKQILRGMALLPVATPFDRVFLKAHLALFEVKDIVPNLSLLVEWGWLEKEGKGFKMHPLIGDVVVEQLEVSVVFAEKYIETVADSIDYSNLNPEHNLFKINKYKFFAERLSYLFFNSHNEKVSFLLDRISYLEEIFGFYDNAIKYSKQALHIAEHVFDKEHETISVRQNNLALIYQLLGQYKPAIDLLEIVLASSIKRNGKNHLRVSNVQNSLGWSYKLSGEYYLAIQFLEKALESALKNLNFEHPTIAQYMSNLGDVYGALGNNDRAANFLEIALASDLKNFGEDHPNIAIKQSNLGNAYCNSGKYDRAIVLLEAALASDLKNFGLEHPIIAIRQSNLAIVYQNLGNYVRAIELLEIALASDLKNLGEEHPEVAIKRNNLANVYADLGNFDRAIELLQMALVSDLQNLGKGHSIVAIRQNNLASIYYQIGRKY